jgi:hypothetical protein
VTRQPFGRGGIKREISHAEASNVAADLLSTHYSAVPRPIVAHRAFHRKIASISVYHDKYKLARRHRAFLRLNYASDKT